MEKVRLIGGWDHVLDSENRLTMCLGEERKFTFDISEAGPGKLTTFSKVKNSTLLEEIPLEQTGAYKFKLAFKPKACGKFDDKLYIQVC